MRTSTASVQGVRRGEAPRLKVHHYRTSSGALSAFEVFNGGTRARTPITVGVTRRL